MAKVTKVVSGPWIAGYQAPKGMRFLQVDVVVNDTSNESAYVGGAQFMVQAPDGQLVSQDTTTTLPVNDSLNPGETKDEGFLTFVLPAAQGDVRFQVFNSDGTLAGQVDLGTI